MCTNGRCVTQTQAVFDWVQRGYLSSRDTLLNSLFGEANNNNVGATMVR